MDGGRGFTDELQQFLESAALRPSTRNTSLWGDSESGTERERRTSGRTLAQILLLLSLGRRGRRRHPLALAAPAAAFVGARTFNNVL